MVSSRPFADMFRTILVRPDKLDRHANQYVGGRFKHSLIAIRAFFTCTILRALLSASRIHAVTRHHFRLPIHCFRIHPYNPILLLLFHSLPFPSILFPFFSSIDVELLPNATLILFMLTTSLSSRASIITSYGGATPRFSLRWPR